MKQRQSSSKVRSGCITCKARHVKCDEGHPACQRCVESLRRCKGYAAVQPVHKQFKLINYFAPSPSKSPPDFPAANFDELRSLDFFIKFTITEIRGTFTADLWSAITQVAYSQSAIPHAIAALGALHEHFKQSGFKEGSSTPKFALQQYGKAIRQLVDVGLANSIGNVLLALISCIIFAAIENLQGHYKATLTHISSGVQILTEYGSLIDASDEVSVRSCKELLRLAFFRLDSQAVEVAGMATVPIVRRLNVSLSPRPDKFSSIEQAYVAFEHFFNYFIHLQLHVEEVFDPNASAEQVQRQNEYRQLDGYFQAWCRAFDKANFLESLPAVRILQLQRIVISVASLVEYSKGETSWDVFTPQFEQSVTIGESFLNDPGESSSFTMSLGIIPPIYFLAHHCRDPRVRRRAIHILSNCRRREGIWDGALFARIGERIISIEEAGADGPVTEAWQIPEQTRITYVEMSMGFDRSATISYRKSRIGSPASGIFKGSVGIPVQDTVVERIDW